MYLFQVREVFFCWTYLEVKYIKYSGGKKVCLLYTPYCSQKERIKTFYCNNCDNYNYLWIIWQTWWDYTETFSVRIKGHWIIDYCPICSKPSDLLFFHLPLLHPYLHLFPSLPPPQPSTFHPPPSPLIRLVSHLPSPPFPSSSSS